MSIEKIRKEIDKTDAEIAKLLAKRFELSRQAATAKKSAKRDEKREKEIIDNVRSAVPEDMSENIGKVYEKLLAQSRQYQKKTKDKQ
ncbi:MAG: chorismate mutase [Clostridia bacterium]|nr:chorismate mutase [Clostridia bacterium]